MNERLRCRGFFLRLHKKRRRKRYEVRDDVVRVFITDLVYDRRVMYSSKESSLIFEANASFGCSDAEGGDFTLRYLAFNSFA